MSNIQRTEVRLPQEQHKLLMRMVYEQSSNGHRTSLSKEIIKAVEKHTKEYFKGK